MSLTLADARMRGRLRKLLAECVYSFGLDASVNVADEGTHLSGTLVGPPGTPYEGGCFHFRYELDENWPFEPERFIFTTPVYHVNVTADGLFPLLADNGGGLSPAMGIDKICMYVLAAFSTIGPRPACWAAPGDEEMFAKNVLARDDIDAYKANARAHTARHAWMPAWSVETHGEHFPPEARKYVLTLLLVGRHLASRYCQPFEYAIHENWLRRVVPAVMGRAPIPKRLTEEQEAHILQRQQTEHRTRQDLYNHGFHNGMSLMATYLALDSARGIARRIPMDVTSGPVAGWAFNCRRQIELVGGTLSGVHNVACAGHANLNADSDAVRERHSACSIARIVELLPAHEPVWPPVNVEARVSAILDALLNADIVGRVITVDVNGEPVATRWWLRSS
jgi:ubiquitin-protein ligase